MTESICCYTSVQILLVGLSGSWEVRKINLLAAMKSDLVLSDFLSVKYI